MKRCKGLGSLILLIILFVHSQSTAKLVLEGTMAVELMADPESYNPLEGRNEIIPGVYSMDITKIGIALRSDDQTNKIRAYFPYLLNASFVDNNRYISVGSMTPADWWQSYFGSNYYFVAQGNPFTVGLSNRKIFEDEDYSFISFGDPLGAFVAPNSDYPMITTKLSGNFLNTQVEAYKIYDSKVSFLPAHEKLPIQVESIALSSGRTIGSYSYSEELADYTLLKLSRPLGGFDISFFYGDKRVDNPGFLNDQTDNAPDYYKPDSTRRLGVLKQNYGVEFSKGWDFDVEVEGEYLVSSGLWREYTGTHIVDGRTMPRWDVLGTVNGSAGHFSLNGLRLGAAKIGVLYRVIDPGFQLIAHRHPDYSYGVYNEIIGDISTPLLLRAIYDPKQRYQRNTQTSSLSKYLGFRSTEVSMELPGSVVGLPSIFRVEGIENRQVDGSYRRKDMDSDTGELLIKDYRQLDTELSVMLSQGNQLVANSTTRKYLADWNYFNRLGLKWEKTGEKLKNSLSIEQYSRLRDFQWPEDDPDAIPIRHGTLSCLSWQLEGVLAKGLTFSARVDLRNGTYEKNLTRKTEDRVLASPYQLIVSHFFAKKDIDWLTDKGLANLTLATEIFRMEGNAANTLLADYLGLGTVGYLGLSYPLFANTRQEVVLLNVNGPEQENFPGRHIKTTFHHELVYSPSDRSGSFRLGYTLRPSGSDIKRNLYAIIGGKVGGGNWSITYGLGTLREFTEPEYLLPGQWRQDNPYLVPEVLGRPWEPWSNSNIAFGNDQTVSQISMRFWYSF